VSDACPIQDWPEDQSPEPRSMVDPRMRRDDDVETTAGPIDPRVEGRPEAVWITAESLGRDDPAMTAHADLPVVFVFDDALLRRLRLSFARLTFLAEALADLSLERQVQTYRGNVSETLADVGPVAATFTPVPGWRRSHPSQRGLSHVRPVARLSPCLHPEY
jgi:deoxyribodipyrimidine photo-lyase